MDHRYGVEAIWEGQAWILDGFHKPTTTMAHAVARTFSSTKGDDAIPAADIPPTCPALDCRRERLMAAALAAPSGTPKKLLLPPPASDDSSRYRVPKWFSVASDRNRLIKEGRQVQGVKPRPRCKTPWVPPPEGRRTCNTWTDGSFRAPGGLGWVVTEDSLGTGTSLHEGARNIGG